MLKLILLIESSTGKESSTVKGTSMGKGTSMFTLCQSSYASPHEDELG